MNMRLDSPQTEIVRLICLDCTSKEVGKILDLAPSKVESHKAIAMQALGASDDTQLKELALEHHVTKQTDGLTMREKRLCGQKRDDSK